GPSAEGKHHADSTCCSASLLARNELIQVQQNSGYGRPRARLREVERQKVQGGPAPVGSLAFGRCQRRTTRVAPGALGDEQVAQDSKLALFGVATERAPKRLQQPFGVVPAFAPREVRSEMQRCFEERLVV